MIVQLTYFECQIAWLLACCIGAIVPVVSRRRRTKLIDQVAINPAHDVLQQMSWRESRWCPVKRFGFKATRLFELVGVDMNTRWDSSWLDDLAARLRFLHASRRYCARSRPKEYCRICWAQVIATVNKLWAAVTHEIIPGTLGQTQSIEQP